MLKLILLLAGCATAQVFDNIGYNSHYETPAGWAVETPTVLYGVITLIATRVGLQPVTMRMSKLGSNEAGYMSPGDETFYRLTRLYNGTASTQAPVLTFIEDTTIGTLHYTTIVAKQIDLNLVIVEHAVSNQNYLHTFIFSTSISDYNTNAPLYGANWANFLFINLNGPAAKVAAIQQKTQSEANAHIFNLLGRSLKPQITVVPGSTYTFKRPQ